MWGMFHELGAEQCHSRPKVENGVTGIPEKWSMTPCTTQI